MRIRTLAALAIGLVAITACKSEPSPQSQAAQPAGTSQVGAVATGPTTSLLPPPTETGGVTSSVGTTEAETEWQRTNPYEDLQIVLAGAASASQMDEEAARCFAEGHRTPVVANIMVAGSWFDDQIDRFPARDPADGTGADEVDVCVHAAELFDVRVACDPASGLGALVRLDESLQLEQRALRIAIYRREPDGLYAVSNWVPWCGLLGSDDRTGWRTEGQILVVPARLSTEHLGWMLDWADDYFELATGDGILTPEQCADLRAAAAARAAVTRYGQHIFGVDTFGFVGTRTPTSEELRKLNDLLIQSHRANLHVERSLALENVNVTGMNTSFRIVPFTDDPAVVEIDRGPAFILGAWLTTGHWEIPSGADVARRLSDIADRRCPAAGSVAILDHPVFEPFDANTAAPQIACAIIHETYLDRNAARAYLLAGDADGYHEVSERVSLRYRRLDRWLFLEPYFEPTDLAKVMAVEGILSDLIVMPGLGRERILSYATERESERQVIDDYTLANCTDIPPEIIHIETVAEDAPRIGE